MAADTKVAIEKSTKHKNIFSHWKDDIKCVFERDPAARNSFEVIVTYPGVQAVMLHRISHRLWNRGWKFLPRVLSFLGRLISNVDIHPGAQIGNRFFIDHGACVVIGETAIVGNDVTLYHGVTLGGTSWNKGRRHPQLGNNVMVGAGAKILGAIEVGDNVRVGANSVVVQAVPADSTVVGIPGRVVKLREAGVPNKFGIDLDHHLIPDPLGKAISCLMDRIDKLETLVSSSGIAQPNYQEALFSECQPDNEICEKDCAGGQHTVNQPLSQQTVA